MWGRPRRSGLASIAWFASVALALPPRGGGAAPKNSVGYESTRQTAQSGAAGSSSFQGPVQPAPSSARLREIIAGILKERNTTFERLRPLSDTVGHRMAGSEGERKAVAWAKHEMEKDGLTVRLESLTEPVWVRGEENAEIVSPVRLPLAMLGLGKSVGTPPAGIEAPVVVVGSYEELYALGRGKVEGRIVVYDAPFPKSTDPLEAYSSAVKFRTGGASNAARLGAVAVLVRSVATASLRSPHTGGLGYADDAPKIPAAAVSVEDAMLIRRLVEAGHEVRVRLVMGARMGPSVVGHNVVGELRGREKPDEIVLIGAHLDSWDVGAGAVDDGAGCAMTLEVMRVLGAGPRPRRTVRAVLFANEENGLSGARAYREAHAGELARHVAAIESDIGAARALGFSLLAGPGGEDLLRSLLGTALETIGAGRIRAGTGAPDISVLREAGVPLLALDLDATHYFDWHHSWADTLDKVDPDELQQATAAYAAVTWALAESEVVLPRAPTRPVAVP